MKNSIFSGIAVYPPILLCPGLKAAYAAAQHADLFGKHMTGTGLEFQTFLKNGVRGRVAL